MRQRVLPLLYPSILPLVHLLMQAQDSWPHPLHKNLGDGKKAVLSRIGYTGCLDRPIAPDLSAVLVVPFLAIFIRAVTKLSRFIL